MKPSMRLVLGVAAAVGTVWLERQLPLRREREPKARRVSRNLAVAGCSALAIQLFETPVILPLLRRVERKHWGFGPRMRLPRFALRIAGVLWMDYTLYLWHILTHRVPWLWRFHAVHHVDLDMDASTALRFHFGEMIASIPYRALQVALFGVDEPAFRAWQTFLLASIVFHHSNLRLPRRWEERLEWLLVTPRLHGLHHARHAQQASVNWSSGLTLWDRLHGSFHPIDHEISVGVRGIDRSKEVTWPRLTAMPLQPPAAVDRYRVESIQAMRFRPGLTR